MPLPITGLIALFGYGGALQILALLSLAMAAFLGWHAFVRVSNR
jgi:hypothetical protein